MDAEQGARIAQARRRTGLTQRGFAVQLGKSESLISKLEQGERELNDLRLARAIAELSGVRLAWLLGLDDGPPVETRSAIMPTAVPPTSSDRRYRDPPPRSRGVVGDVASAFVLGGLAATLSTGAPQPPATARVSNYQTPIGAETLADLRAVAASYRRAYRSVPASQLYLAAHEHLSLTLALRPAYQPAAVQTELLITVGEMAALAGTLLTLDLGQVGDAGQYLELAHRAAREACAVELEAVVLGCRSFHAAYGLDDRRLGLDFAEVAVTIARDGAHPLTRGWVAAVASERHADVGDDHRTHRRLDAARHALSLDGGSTPWLGIGAFDHAKATAYEGGGLRRLGHHHQAVTVLSTALDQLHPTMYRHRTTALIDRAEAQLSAGDVDAACADAGAALELTSHTGHAGSTARLEALARATLTTRCAAARRLWQDLLAAKATTMGSR